MITTTKAYTDDDGNTYRVEKASRQYLISMTQPTPEGVWFRSAKVEGGIVTMEMRIFHDEQASEKEEHA